MFDITPRPPVAPMSSEPDWALLTDFLRGACPPEAAAAVERWEAEDPANARLLALMRRVWHEAAVDEEEGWRALRARIAAESARPVVRPLRFVPGAETRPIWRRPLVGAAAAALLLGAVGLVVRERMGASPAAPEPAREYVTARGERGELMLVDGTRVWLSVDSRLLVRPGYGAQARDVELNGEAYFIVEHDSTRPFRVHTGAAVLEDLGTEFDVRAYPGDDEVRVVVASGRVAMRGDTAMARADAGVELAQGQMGTLDGAGRIQVVDSVDLGAALGWREGGLRFRRRPAAEVLRELERWYDLEIVLEDSSLAPVLVTAVLSGRTADQALAVIAGVLDVRYTRHDRQVRLLARPPR
jgi:transmembrane sensor